MGPTVSRPPELFNSTDRKKSIIEDSPAIFPISDDGPEIGSKPIYELDIASQVHNWCGTIAIFAKQYKVDADLIGSIMYMETTHGWYDMVNPLRKTILPMNIHFKYWRDLGVTKEKLNCPQYNIEFGVILLSRIQARIERPTIRKIATIYNFLGAEKVSEYGARVDQLARELPWQKKACYLR